MKQRKLFTGFFAAAGMFLLILDSRTALAGARTGLQLCIRTVIPSLLPFFLLTGILTGALMGMELPVLRPLGTLLGIPKGGESLLIPAFLGGYPMGARAVAESYEEGQLSRRQAVRLLFFCSNAGPAFLFGMVAPMFNDPAAGWVLWAIHLGSAAFLGAMLPSVPGNVTNLSRKDSAQSMKGAVSAMALVCGWVICFRVITAFLSRWFLWRVSPEGQAVITGLLELTNGCLMLKDVAAPELRFLLCAVLLSLGGLCITMQTLSVLHGLPLWPYALGKLLQAVISTLLGLSLLRGLWAVPLSLGILAVLVRITSEKRSGNSLAAGV